MKSSSLPTLSLAAAVALAVALATRGASAFSPSSPAMATTAATTTLKTQPATTGPWGVVGATASTALFAESSATAKNEMNLDDDFDDVNLVRLMGLKRLKKIARRHKRELNARIRNFEVVQDSEGDWVEATPEQTSEMKSAAGVAVPAPAEDSGSDDPIKIIIAGAPASGKGTQCEVIKEKYGVVHLSTGDMLREAVAQGTEVGLAAKDYMDAGKLVPDEVIIGVVKDRLDQPDCQSSGWLLDGFPRTPGQAEALASAGVTADCFVFLNVPDSVLVERVCGRRTDPVTGKIYHMTFSPPPENDEEVLARLEQRSDDTEEKVVVRLEQFHANVEAVKGSYKDIALEVDGNRKPEEVTASIMEGIDAKIAA
eukprot:CAMPEP_0197449118 /NCGR_PEP_ID=MMETSP1175-20131217/20151_1 /TAXON_ID=1003142 /ORGANISM="Triceratium dubium, Strain CCMP147" /LENGTH=368 /DNA_ID=CAMNT_0042981135 /DNA_START=63 /DNA_END=1169 /DNA_ORIENTATION=-